MGLLYREAEIGSDVIALECHSCHYLHVVGDSQWDYLGSGPRGELTCAVEDCGVSGFIPRLASGRRSERGQITDRFPGVPTPFTPLPNALLDHRDELGLDPNELLVVMALERYRRRPGDEVWPARETIASHTGLSVRTISRAIGTLQEKGLLSCRQPGRSRVGDGRASNRYSLDPLWSRLAEVSSLASQIGALGEMPSSVTP